MKNSVVAICIIGSIAIGLYAYDVFYTNYVLSQFKSPEINVLSVEQYKSFPLNDLAEFTRDSQAVLIQQTEFAKEQQAKLRSAIIALGAWGLLLTILVVFSGTKALNKFSLHRPAKKTAGLDSLDARRN